MKWVRHRADAWANRRLTVSASRRGSWWRLLLTVLTWAALATGTVRSAEGAGHPGKSSAKKAEATTQEAGPAKKPSGLEEVTDTKDWHFSDIVGPDFHLPKIFGFQITKFMVLELIAAGLILAIYIPLARRLQNGEPARGWRDNAFEVLLTFIRDEVAKPSIGEHEADRYVPFLWTMFLFILFCNLLGLIPFAGSPTASIYVTGGLAVCVFFAIHGAAVAKMGLIPYVKSLWPDIDVPFPLGLVLKPMVFVIEVVGVLVRNAVLAVRLFANMFAGHMVLATILLFIVAAAHTVFGLWFSITLASILGVIALSLLEIFIAFLQAYIFVFLSALFMGMAMHPEH